MAEARLFYRTAGGVLASRVLTGESVEAPALPEGATALTEAEYATALDEVRAERQEYADTLVATATANQTTDYQALRTLNVPEATARRLTGYTGPADEES
jgi:hypothetical protein